MLLALLWLTAARWQPVIAPDEFGPISIARYLAGVAPMMHLEGAPHMSFGLGLVLAPLFALAPGPLWAYKAGIVFGCLLAVLVLPLAHAVARRFVGPRQAMVAAIVTALYPALWVQTQYLWNEVALMTGFLGLCWLALRCLEAPRVGNLWPFVVLACFLYALHERAMAVPVVALGFLLALLPGTDRRTRWQVLAAAAGLLLLAWGVRLGDGYFWALGWGTERGITPGALLDKAMDPARWLALLKATALQVWYLIAASLGLVLLALAGLYRQWRDGDAMVRRRVLALGGFLLACSLASLLPSAITMMDPVRGDQFLYGRYNEAFLLPWLVLGVALAPRAGWRLAGSMVVLFVGLTAWAVLFAGVEHWQYMLPFNVSGVVALFLAVRGPAAFAICAAVALAIMLWCAWSGRRFWQGPLLAGLVFVVTTGFTMPIVQGLNHTMDSRIETGPALLATLPDTVLAFDLSTLPPYLYYHLQAALPHKHVLSFEREVPAEATVVISDAAWGKAHRQLAPCRLAREPHSQVVYWRMHGGRACLPIVP